MNFFTRLGRLALLAAVLLTWVCVFDIAAQGKSGAATFTDRRDGRVYKTVKMPDGNTWMAENLNHKTGNSWCYEGKDANCKKYGRLYDWNTAKTACPVGWHLPSREEWQMLVLAVDPNAQLSDNWDDDNVAGTKLKAKGGWNSGGNGSDDYCFSALPGGNYLGNYSYDAGDSGYWWTATEDRCVDACYRGMDYNNEYMYEYDGRKSYGFSVRCLQD
jgi:uncharacterized protein (TIGR02145 family)